MPRRTNEFQRLIYLIQHQLAAGATVTESKFLSDRRSGKPVEVDIVIETKVGEIPFVIGIECTAEGRPATVEWVREMIGKHADLPVNKTVLVAKLGFTREATEKALAHGIDVTTLKEAEDTNWTAFIEQLGNLALGDFVFNVTSWRVLHETPKSGTPQIAIGPHSIIREAGGKTTGSLQDYINGTMRNRNVVMSAIKHWLGTPRETRKLRFGFAVTWKAPEETSIQDDQENLYQMHSLEVSVVATVESTPLRLEPGQFVGARVAYGTARNIFDKNESTSEKVLVTMFGKENEFDAGVLMIPGQEGGGTRIYSMKFPMEEEKDGA